MPDLRESLQWVRSGADLFAKALAALDDDRLTCASALPDRTGADIVAQVIERLGVYARAFGADASPAGDGNLREGYADSAAALVGLLADRPNRGDWTDTVTLDGSDEVSAEVLWPLARDLMVHAVDLGGPVTFRELPADFLEALVEDITRQRSADGTAMEVLAQDTGEAWRVDGPGVPVRVLAPLADLAAWLSGRGDPSVKVLGPGELPDLSRWP